MEFKQAIVYPNLYYKDDRQGFRFELTSGVYENGSAQLQNAGLCRSIEELIKKVIGNASVLGWLGGVVKDAKGKSYYVFGHNTMKEQESGKSRKSIYFPFITFAFEDISRLANLKKLMDIVERLQRKDKKEYSNEGGFAVPPVEYGYADNSSYLSDWMASYAVDPTYTMLSASLTKSECEFDISYLLKNSIFPDKTPVIFYQERDDLEASEEKPRSCWSFQVNGGHGSSSKPKCEGSKSNAQNQYLKEAIAALCQNDEYRKAFLACCTAEWEAELKKAIGSSNTELFYQIACWKFALDHNCFELLPTKAEKDAILKKLCCN